MGDALGRLPWDISEMLRLPGIIGNYKETGYPAIRDVIQKSKSSVAVGASLLVYLESWALINDLEKLELEVWSNNVGAISLYKKEGYAIEGCRRQAVKTNNQTIDLILMGKMLANKDFT